MTQTTPSHSQAVEAEPIAIVNKTTCISVHRGNEVLANFAGPESHANARLFAAALTSQQEVAAPVGMPDALRDLAKECPEIILYNGSTSEPYFDIGGADLWCNADDFTPERRRFIGFMADAANYVCRLAASRVPVASLASREQGVEAVGAVQPEGDVQLRACDQGTGREYFIKMGPRAEMQAEADRQNGKGRDYFVIPPAQPKAPAPVPVVQGEASVVTEDEVAMLAPWFDPEVNASQLRAAMQEFADSRYLNATPAPEQATTGSGQDSGSVHLGSGECGEVQGPFRIAALADISAERTRQMRVKGWTPEHDSQHNNGELAEAASVYAMPNWKRRMSEGNPPTDQVWPIGWPWNLEDFKPKDDRRNLVKAGALIVAEIERLDRAAILSTASPAGEVKA